MDSTLHQRDISARAPGGFQRLSPISEYDIAIIGSGPGGYVAGIRAGQLGFKTVVIEKSELGGICLNWGCIPSKALLRNAEILSLFKRSMEFGIAVDKIDADFSKGVDRSRKVVDRLTKGVASLLKKNGVDILSGAAHFTGPNTLKIEPGDITIKANNIIISTGGSPKTIPPLPIDGEMVVTYMQAIIQREVPKAVVIVGGGAIGVEFASIYQAYGSDVTLVEMLPRILPNEDDEISKHLERGLRKRGIKILTNSRVLGLTKSEGYAKIQVEKEDGAVELDCDRVLVAIGIQGNVEGIGLENIGVQPHAGFIQVNENLETSTEGVYAIGDVTGELLLAHVASAQGIYVVERIAGIENPKLNYIDMPKATYSSPQVASFGLTEQQARDEGRDVIIGKFPLIASGKALALAETEGMVKLVTERTSGELLGAHLIGSEVTELLSGVSMTRMLEGTTLEMGGMVYSHPTLSEALKEAALSTRGEAIHV